MKKIAAILLSVWAMHVWADAPKVVVSILPLYHIAQAVMGDVGSPVLLVPQGASEHAYALKPSQYEAITQADVVIWVGPTLETYLVEALAKVPEKNQMTLLNDRSMIRYALRDTAHDPQTLDPHLWLDPLNAITVATQLEKRLSALDPAHQKLYRRQTEAFVTKIAALNSALAKQLNPFQSAPFVDYHDAFQYFEKRYGLKRLDSISTNPHVPLSATRWIEMSLELKSEHIHCIFSEPQNQSDLLRQLATETQAQLAMLDPIGTTLPAGTDGYVALLTAMANSFSGCLGR